MRLALLVVLFAAGSTTCARDRVLDDGWHHVRNADPAEWAEFPAEAERRGYERTFEAAANDGPLTLLVRQLDVKQRWTVAINGTALGSLVVDEIDLVASFTVPAGTLVEGENRLSIKTKRTVPDDIRVGRVRLIDGPPGGNPGAGRLVVRVRDGSEPTPARLTILDEDGSRAAVHCEPNERLAVRPGVVYTGDGSATIGLRPGRYTVFAGRGFEWSRARAVVDVRADAETNVELAITRAVDTAGWVACDTHVHTLTESGHGDSTLEERMVTLAGEGVELAIATEHNKHSDYAPTARRLGLDRHFTTAIGNEVTTKVGHFNVFPVRPGAPPPDHRPTEWKPIFENIHATPGVRAVILNHARDVHSGVTPFGPAWHLSLVGRNLKGWRQRANAMEVVNSGAQQTDPLQLTRDWFGMVNAGRRMTPVGSSDSHDVARHFVGQGRTYLRANDIDPGAIDVEKAVDAFVAGRVLVSCGLLVTLDVADGAGPGDFATVKGRHRFAVEVRRPGWVEADRCTLYRNGRAVWEREVGREGRFAAELDAGPHDFWYTAVALGKRLSHPSWPIAKPYQPDAPTWPGRPLALTGAVYVDADGDGRWTSPRAYAERIVEASNGDRAKVIAGLATHDATVAAFAADLLREAGLDPLSAEFRSLVRDAGAATRTGFEEYATAWRASVVAGGE